jgi:hypothetical protein
MDQNLIILTLQRHLDLALGLAFRKTEKSFSFKIPNQVSVLVCGGIVAHPFYIVWLDFCLLLNGKIFVVKLIVLFFSILSKKVFLNKYFFPSGRR